MKIWLLMCLLTKICHRTKCPRLENSALTYSTWEAISHYLCFLFWSGTERREKSTSCQSKLIHYIFLSKFMAFVFFLDLTIYSFWPFVYSNVYKIKLYLNITKYRLAMSRQKFKNIGESVVSVIIFEDKITKLWNIWKGKEIERLKWQKSNADFIMALHASAFRLFLLQLLFIVRRLIISNVNILQNIFRENIIFKSDVNIWAV